MHGRGAIAHFHARTLQTAVQETGGQGAREAMASPLF